MSNFTDTTFIDLALSGAILTTEIESYVESWHAGTFEFSLREFLGMTAAEYSLWLSDADMLDTIVMARHRHIALTEAVESVVNDNYDLDHSRVAARSDDIAKIQKLTRWLRNEGIG